MNFITEHERKIMQYVDNLIPESLDAEINYALKKYYLATEFSEEEVMKIVMKREKEIEEMKQVMEITSYEELDKSNDMIRDNVENSSDSTIQGHPDDSSLNRTDGIDTTERRHEE